MLRDWSAIPSEDAGTRVSASDDGSASPTDAWVLTIDGVEVVGVPVVEGACPSVDLAPAAMASGAGDPCSAGTSALSAAEGCSSALASVAGGCSDGAALTVSAGVGLGCSGVISGCLISA